MRARKRGRKNAAPQNDEVHRGGEHDRRRSHWQTRYESRTPEAQPAARSTDYPEILREYASSGFRDDPRSKK